MASAVLGGFVTRLGIGGLPFLLPLLYQLGLSMPAWQSGLDIKPVNPGQAGGRIVPDVSANASANTGYFVVAGGQQEISGGTSAATPLWAGLVARMNQQLAASGKRGVMMMPLVDDEVVVGFEHGDLRRPFVLGCLWNGTGRPEDLAAKGGGVDQVRLFIAPGVYHCGGGPGPDRFDMLTALDAWVQQGTAPRRIIATKAGLERPGPNQWWSTGSSGPRCSASRWPGCRTAASSWAWASTIGRRTSWPGPTRPRPRRWSTR